LDNLISIDLEISVAYLHPDFTILRNHADFSIIGGHTRFSEFQGYGFILLDDIDDVLRGLWVNPVDLYYIFS
jgi:hypothetical protein